MSLQIEGIYEDGKVTLKSVPPGLHKAKVLVTFMEGGANEAAQAAPQGDRTFASLYGALRGKLDISEEDFKAAEWHPKPEDRDV